MSVSAWANAAFAAGATLTLNALSSSDFDFSSPYNSQAGVRANVNGDIQELNTVGSWVSQNSGVEWIDDGGATASDYEVRLSVTSSSGTATFSGPALGSFHTLSTTRQYTWTKTVVGSFQWNGTMTIREIADTSNSVSATVSISIENGSL